MAGKDISVKSPAFLPDIDTDEPREVDIAITSKIGSTTILVVLECRYESLVGSIQCHDSAGADPTKMIITWHDEMVILLLFFKYLASHVHLIFLVCSACFIMKSIINPIWMKI